jgi:hypothetical protein
VASFDRLEDGLNGLNIDVAMLSGDIIELRLQSEGIGFLDVIEPISMARIPLR